MASLILDPSRTVDPRTPLERAHRHELYNFAAAHGVTEISSSMPADIMRAILFRKGLTHIGIHRTLGEAERVGGTAIIPTRVTASVPQPPVQQPQQDGETISPQELLERQWFTQNQPTAQLTEEQKPAMPSAKWLREECKRRDIKIPRGANAETLMGLLNGNAS